MDIYCSKACSTCSRHSCRDTSKGGHHAAHFCLISTSDQLFSLCGLGQEGAVSEREEQELCQAKVQENLQTVLTWFCCTNNSRLILEEYHRKTLAEANNDNFLPVKIYKLSILNCLLVKVTFLLHFLLMKVSAPAVSKNASLIVISKIFKKFLEV